MVNPSEDPQASVPSADPPFERLVQRFSTPLFVNDIAVLRRRVAVLRQALPERSTLLYSVKANPLPPVVAALRRAGCGSEVSSLGELATVLGVGPVSGPILYTGPGKSAAELRAAMGAGATISCESVSEVARALDCAGKKPLGVVLRIQSARRPPAGLSMADGRPFGLLEEEVAELCRSYGRRLEVLGFHCYVGSQLPTCEALLAAFGHAVDVVERLARACGVTPEIVDLGGGFPWPYSTPGGGPDLAPLSADLERMVAPLQARRADIWFESGRSLVAPAGKLLTTVMDVKQRRDTSLVVIDAGVNILGGMSGLGRVLRPSTVLRNLSAPDGAEVTADVVGPLCTPLDCLAVKTTVASPRVGDLLCIENVGAYAATAALSSFLSRPAATELITDGDEVVEAWALENRHVPVRTAITTGTYI